MPRDIDLQSEIELSDDIAISRREIAEGKGIPNDIVFDNLHKMLMRMKAEDEASARQPDPEP